MSDSDPISGREITTEAATATRSGVEAARETERLLDEALAETFPASDPVAANLRRPKLADGAERPLSD